MYGGLHAACRNLLHKQKGPLHSKQHIRKSASNIRNAVNIILCNNKKGYTFIFGKMTILYMLITSMRPTLQNGQPHSHIIVRSETKWQMGTGMAFFMQQIGGRNLYRLYVIHIILYTLVTTSTGYTLTHMRVIDIISTELYSMYMIIN